MENQVNYKIKFIKEIQLCWKLIWILNSLFLNWMEGYIYACHKELLKTNGIATSDFI
jgi:hypothetical protein